MFYLSLTLILGVPVTVTGVAQVKIMTESDEYLSTACEQFLGKSEDEIKGLLLETFEGHLRAIVGTMEVEELFQDRESFAHNVREVAATDVSKMGIKILSFTIKGKRVSLKLFQILKKYVFLEKRFKKNF